MPSKVNPASVKVGKGLAPNGTVDSVSLLESNRDVQSLNAHLHDPVRSHMASSIGIVDAGGYYTSDEVEGALQELGAGGAAGRHNGLIIGGTFTSGAGTLTLDSPTVVLIDGVAASFGGASVALSPSSTLYIWIDPSSSTLVSTLTLPPVSSEPVLIAKVVTNAGSNVTSSQDARFFVANLDRKLDYTLRSDGSPINDASEACFVTLDAALFWLENYVSTGQERKATVIVRGEHTINGTVTIPPSVENLEFRGEGEAVFATGGILSPAFSVNGTVGLTFSGIAFRCDHTGAIAIRSTAAATRLKVDNCNFFSGGGTWARCIMLGVSAATPHIGHIVTNSQFVANTYGVSVECAVDCSVRNCKVTINPISGSSFGVRITSLGGVGENCVVDQVRVDGTPATSFFMNCDRTTLSNSQSTFGYVEMGGINSVVSGCSITDVSTYGILASSGDVTVSSCTVTTSSASYGIYSSTSGKLTVVGCTVSGFQIYGISSSNADFTTVSSTVVRDCVTALWFQSGNIFVSDCQISGSRTGIQSTGGEICVSDCNIDLNSNTGLVGLDLFSTNNRVRGCKVINPRPRNSYSPPEVPFGVLLRNNGNFLISDCEFEGFYDSANNTGGGVGDSAALVPSISVFSSNFRECGINISANINSADIGGCNFSSDDSNSSRVGIFLSGVSISDVTVSGCSFKFSGPNIIDVIRVSGTNTNRLVVSDCTYASTAVSGTDHRFLYASASASGEGITVSGNSVSYPACGTSGPITISGISGVSITGNTFVTPNSASSGYALDVNSGPVSFVGNVVSDMGGVFLRPVNVTFPVAKIVGNTFNGSTLVPVDGIRTKTENLALLLTNLSVSDNTFVNLDNVLFIPNPLGVDVRGLQFRNNRIQSCTAGITADVIQMSSSSISGNAFSLKNHMLHFRLSAADLSEVEISNNMVEQNSAVLPVTSPAIIGISSDSAEGLNINSNTIRHQGDMGGIHLVTTRGILHLNVNENSVFNEIASSAIAIKVSANALTSPVDKVSVSGNKVSHFGSTYQGIFFQTVTNQPSISVKNVRIDRNAVTSLSNDANTGIECRILATLVANPVSTESISVCNNTLGVNGFPIVVLVENPLRAQGIHVCDNSSVYLNGSFGMRVYLSSATPPDTAYASDIRVDRNTLHGTEEVEVIDVYSGIPVSNLSVDHNNILGAGQVGSVIGPNIGVKLFVVSGSPSFNASTNVSISHNKISPLVETSYCYGSEAIHMEILGTYSSTVKNTSIVGNQINRPYGDGVSFKSSDHPVYGLRVSDNDLQGVGYSPVKVDCVSLQELSIDNNTSEDSGDSNPAIWVIADSGGFYSICNNRLSKVGHKGIFLDGSGSTSTLENVVISHNSVYHAPAATEGSIDFYWYKSVRGVTIHGNILFYGLSGLTLEIGPLTVSLETNYLEGVTIRGNNVISEDYGIVVSHQPSVLGFGGGVLSRDINISGNTAECGYGVQFEQNEGGIYNLTLCENNVKMTTPNWGAGVALDCNDCDVYSSSLSGNTVYNGSRGLGVFSGDYGSLSNVSVNNNCASGDSLNQKLEVAFMGKFTDLLISNNNLSGSELSALQVYSNTLGSNFVTPSSNLSIVDNTIGDAGTIGIYFNLDGDRDKILKNISVSRNSIKDWGLYDGSPGIYFQCGGITIYNLTMDGNSLTDTTHGDIGGFWVGLKAPNRVMSFSHNKVFLNDQAGVYAMDWTFYDAGTPENFTFLGNIFRRTNNTAPTYTGVEGNFATFYGNIGSAPSFWTNFAAKFDNGGAGVVLPATISSHNIDDGSP